MGETKLAHVSIRNKEYGWVHITPEEADKQCDAQTVSANDRLFLCERCGQYVAFTKRGVYTRYFKHSRGEEDKNCEDRCQQFAIYPKIQYERYAFPLKLVAKEKSFSLFIGITQDSSRAIKNDCLEILIKGHDAKAHTFSVAERLQVNGITWLPLYQDISSRYQIKTPQNSIPSWPNYIPGIHPAGALFDGHGDKMLQEDGETSTGHDYFLLTNKRQYYCADIECRELLHMSISGEIWRVYKVKAVHFSPDSVRFFLLLRTHLVRHPISLNIIWPPTVIQGNTIYHHAKKLYAAHNGGEMLRLQLFPNSGQRPQNAGSYFQFDANGFQQMLAVNYHDGQESRGSHIMLWDKLPETSPQLPKVQLFDRKGVVLEEDIYFKLPDANELNILAEFDGKIMVQLHGTTKLLQAIKATEQTTIPVSFGNIIKVFQGCDVIKSIEFQHKNKPSSPDEVVGKLLRLLDGIAKKTVSINHAFGSCAARLPNDSLLRTKLRACINAGEISEEAYHYIAIEICKSVCNGEEEYYE